MTETTSILWRPTAERIAQANLSAFMRRASDVSGIAFNDYHQLYQWSVDHSEAFWSLLWDECDVLGDKGPRVVLDAGQIETACWFPDAQLNYAENLLRQRSDEVAIFFRVEDQIHSHLTFNQLFSQVCVLQQWMISLGIVKGDRVAACLPNMPESVVAMLAATSLGAVWTSTSPDFGVDSVVDRFGQTEPKLLFFCDGYYYSGKAIDCRDKRRQIVQQLGTLKAVVEVPLLQLEADPSVVSWQDTQLDSSQDEIDFVPVNFNDPLFILYSSGTTGKPKCITHKVGGVLLQHLKEHRLHSDIKKGDRVFYFTTCGWMMWNWLVSALASEASLVLYDGNPFYPDGNVLWDYADAVDLTLFGTSAKYIDALKKQGIHPKQSHQLKGLKTLCSTGSVLAPESFDYVYQSIKPDVNLASISGGTDIVSCFVLGNPLLPVYRGQCQCRGLGMAVDVFDEQGQSLIGKQGELVCRNSFPSQPLCFWGDPDGSKYHDAYFARFENVWHHGDYVTLTEHGGMIIFGRSDATLNPGGVRIGTAEIYRHVEQLDAVEESIVIGQDWQHDVRVVLFVKLIEGLELDEALIRLIRQTIRDKCSPRHVPARIIQVPEIPRTRSGKIVELAVRDVVHHREVKNMGALANPQALEYYKNVPQLQE